MALLAHAAPPAALPQPASQERYFKGIPYAADTGGANRWLPPQPRPAWTSPLNATVLGPGCFQTHHNADVPHNLSEDCLNVNVWTPPNAVGACVRVGFMCCVAVSSAHVRSWWPVCRAVVRPPGPLLLQTSTSALPVAIFFHGGSFAEGSDQGPFDMVGVGFAALPCIVCACGVGGGVHMLGLLPCN